MRRLYLITFFHHCFVHCYCGIRTILCLLLYCIFLPQFSNSVLRFPYLADGLWLAGFLLHCDNIILWRVFCASRSPTLCLVLTSCKALWSVDLNFKHGIYFDCGNLLCSVKKSSSFLFNAFISFPWNNLLGFGFLLLIRVVLLVQGPTPHPRPLPPRERQRLFYGRFLWPSKNLWQPSAPCSADV